MDGPEDENRLSSSPKNVCLECLLSCEVGGRLGVFLLG